MPQFVWSKNHAYHHKTNGNWELYKGPLSIATLEEYQSMSDKQKKRYRLFRHPLLFVGIGGLLYVLINPRVNWLLGLFHVFKDALRSPASAFQILKKMESKKWRDLKEFKHMTYNNLTLITLWFFMIQGLGGLEFFSLYVISLGLSGGLGILFFTVQHNFENSYASDSKNVNYYLAALKGTSYLKLPKILNWFTADIGYHHIHHLSALIPNYQLRPCHLALKQHFTEVPTLTLKDIPRSLEYILWDQAQQKLTSIVDTRQT